MRQLTLAVDCDDVLLPSLGSIIEVYNQKYDTNVDLVDAYTIDCPDWQASPEEIVDRIYDIQVSEEFTSIRPFRDAIEVCTRLADYHKLNLVTARPGKIMPVTLAMLNEYFPDVFQEIEHVGLGGSKGDICRFLQSDVLIDDNYHHLENAKQCNIENLIWFGDYPWQRKALDSSGVIRCLDWSDVEQEIERIANL